MGALWLGIASRSKHCWCNALIFLVFSLVFHSCSSISTDQESQTKKPNKVFALDLDKDDSLKFFYETKSNFDYAQELKDSIALLAVTNKRLNSIDFYRLDKGKKVDSLMLSIEGPNGLPRLSNFLIDSDTLYAINAFSYELVMFNLNGIALKRIRVRPNIAHHSLLPRYFTNSLMVKQGDYIYVFGDPDLNPLDKKTYSKGKYGYQVNVKTGDFDSIFDVPQIYREDQWMINQYFYRQLFVPERNGWLFSFEVDDSIRLYAEEGEIEAYFAGSQLTGSIKKWNRKDMNSEEAYRYYLSNKSYSKLVYDQKNELYYRFVRHPNRQAVIDKDVDAMWFRRFSIVILDKQLNWVGETMFDNPAISEVHLSLDSGVYLGYFDEGTAVEGEKLFYRLRPTHVDP